MPQKRSEIKKESIVIDTTDCFGKRVILTKKKLKEKSQVHTEMRNAAFISNIPRTLEKPELVYPDYSDPKCRRCYYRKYSPLSYIKVVVYCKSIPCNVVSAYETNYIKEEKYNLKRLV